MFTIIFVLAMSIGILLIYVLLLAHNETIRCDIVYPLSFCKKKLKFNDIPFCPGSVHARYLFQHLSKEERMELSQDDRINTFFGSEFNLFINWAVIETILGIVSYKQFNSNLYTCLQETDLNRELIKIKYLEPDSLTDFFVPNLIDKIVCNDETQAISISCAYGKVNFNWNIAYCNLSHYSAPLVMMEENLKQNDFHDFEIHISMQYSLKLWKMFSKREDWFMKWIQKTEQNLRQLDWSQTEKHIPFIIYKKLAEKDNKR